MPDADLTPEELYEILEKCMWNYIAMSGDNSTTATVDGELDLKKMCEMLNDRRQTHEITQP